MCRQQIALLKGQQGFVFYGCFTHLSFNSKETRRSSLKARSGLDVLEGQEHRKQSQVKKIKKEKKKELANGFKM